MDLRGDIRAERFNLLVVDLVGTHDDAQLATGLDGVGLGDTGIAHGDVLEILQALDVSLRNLATCTGTCTADGIADQHDGGDERGHLHLFVVSTDSVADVRLLLVLLGQLGAIECVWQFGLLIGHLANVVEQTCALRLLGIQAQLTGHHGAEVGRLAGVLQQILAVAGAVFHLTHDADELGVQAVDAEVDGGALAGFHDLFVHLLLHLGHHFLDARGVDAAVGDELVQGQTSYLTAHRVEAADDDGVGGVIDDNLCSGGSFEGTDVAAFATDDAAFHVVVVDVEHRHAVLHGSLCGYALDGLDDDALGLLVGGHLGVVHDLVDVAGGSRLGLVLQRLHEALLGFLGGETADFLELCALLSDEAFEALAQLLLFLQEQGLLLFHALALVLLFVLATCDLILTLVQADLALLQAVLALLDLLVALLHFLLQLCFLVQELLLDFQEFLLFDDLCILLGFFVQLTHAIGASMSIPDQLINHCSNGNDRRGDGDD